LSGTTRGNMKLSGFACFPDCFVNQSLANDLYRTIDKLTKRLAVLNSRSYEEMKE